MSSAFSIILFGEPLNEHCNTDPLATHGWILWKRKQQRPPSTHYFHQRGCQMRQEIKSLTAETIVKQLSNWIAGPCTFLYKFRQQWSSKSETFLTPYESLILFITSTPVFTAPEPASKLKIICKHTQMDTSIISVLLGGGGEEGCEARGVYYCWAILHPCRKSSWKGIWAHV